MSDTIARLSRADNGFVIYADDPKIRAKNKTSKGAYVSPERCYVFDDFKGVLKWLKENEENLVPEKDEYASAFDEPTAAA